MTVRHRASSGANKSDRDRALLRFSQPAGRRGLRDPVSPDDGYPLPTEAGKSLREYVLVVLERKWVVLLCIAVGLGIAVAFILYSPPYYVARATITMLNNHLPQEEAPSTEGIPRPEDFHTYVISRASTLAQVMNSFAIRKTVAIQMAKPNSEKTKRVREPVSTEKAPQPGFLSPVAMPKVSMRPERDTPRVVVSTKAKKPDMALLSLKAYLHVLQEHCEQQRLSDALKALAWLKEGLLKAEEDLRKSREALQDFKKKHGMLYGDSAKVLSKRLTSGSIAPLWWMDENRSDDGVSSEQNGTGLNSPAKNDPQDPYRARLQERLASLQAQYAETTQVYSPTYPKAVLLKKKVDLLQGMISDRDQRERGAISANAQAAKELEKKERQDAWHELVRLNRAGPEFRLLEMEVETNERFYDLLFKEYRKAERRIGAIKDEFVLSSPTTVTEMAPTYWKSLAIGGVLGLFGGLAIALMLGSLDTTIRSAGEMEKHFSCRSLGTVPDLPAYRNQGSSSTAGQPLFLELASDAELESPILDPFRNIQTSLFLSHGGRRIRCLAVSSSLPAEGKTFVAVSLAGVMCLDKSKSVLVIDTDLRRPRIHRVFGHSHPGPGLTTLVQKGSVDWSGMVHSSRLPGLYYMMSGPIPRDPVATLRSDALEEVIASLKASFDVIIIDTPPLLGFPDAVIMSAWTDGTVVVVEQGRIRREVIAESLRSLSSARGTRLLGCVLNKARPSRKTVYGYFSAYSRRYGHYS